jgi:hypothetical protein
MNARYAVRARSIEVSGQPVPRFRVAVVDARNRPVHFAYGATPQQARARAAFWIADEAAIVH